MTEETEARDLSGIDAVVYNTIRERFSGVSLDGEVKTGVGLRVPRESLLEVARALRDMPETACDYLSNITGADMKENLRLVYHLLSLKTGAKVTLVVDVPTDDAEVDSVTPLWETANWHEREAWDMVGIRFRNHPDLRRLLLWEGYEGHPLRKDFVDQRPKRERFVKRR